MPTVIMPDGQEVEMPDELTPELANRLRQMHSAGSSNEEKPASKMNLKDIMKRGKASLMEVGRVADTAVRGGLLGLPKLALEGGKMLEEAMPESVRNATTIPGLGKLRDSAIEAMTPLKPQTDVGQVTGNIGSSIVGSVAGPGNMLKNVLIGGGAGLGAETAAIATDDNPVARLGGGLLGGGIAGLATATRGNAKDLANEALEGLTPEELTRASNVMRTSKESGIPLNLAQALDRDSNVDAYISTLAQSPQGKKTAELLREQPTRVQEVTRKNINDLPGQASDPYTIANETQKGASKVFSELNKERSEIWKNTKNAAAQSAPKEVTNREAMDAIAYIDDLQKRFTPKQSEHGLLQDLKDRLIVDGKPLTNPDQIHDTLKDFKASMPIMNLGNKSVSNDAKKYVKSIAQEIPERLGPAMRPYIEADRAYSEFTKNVNAPMKKSIIGRLAGKKGALNDQEAGLSPLETMFRKGTSEGGNSQILKMEEEFRKVGKQEAYQDAVKSHLVNKVDDAFKSNSNRVNPKSAENLSHNLGNFEQLSNVSRGTNDMLVGLARSKGIKDEDAYASGFRKFMNIVARASNRPTSVSGTGFAEIHKKAEGNIFQRMGQVSIIQPLRQPALAYARLLKDDSLGTIDRLLNSPEGISMLVTLGKQPRMNQTASTAITSFLATNANIQGNRGLEAQPMIGE